jgi:hypothetical protein
MPHLVEFEWYRDASETGWSLVPEVLAQSIPRAVADPRGEVGTLTATFVSYAVPHKPARIVHRDGKLQPHWPLRDFPKLFDQFSRANTAEKLLSFVKTFGPLSNEGRNPKVGDYVIHLLDHARQMQLLINAHRSGQRKEIATIVGPKGLPLDRGALGDVRVMLVFDPVTEKPRLQFTPKHLLSALWLQLGDYLSDEPNLIECRHCGSTFERGPGAGRRGDAMFCSDQLSTASSAASSGAARRPEFRPAPARRRYRPAARPR